MVCPGLYELALWREGRLEASEAACIHSHMNTYERCRRAISELPGGWGSLPPRGVPRTKPSSIPAVGRPTVEPGQI